MEPNLDLFGFDVGENGTLSDELLTAKRTWFWTFMVEPLQCFHLFRCVPNVLAVVQCHLAPIFAGWTHRHHPFRIQPDLLLWLIFVCFNHTNQEVSLRGERKDYGRVVWEWKRRRRRIKEVLLRVCLSQLLVLLYYSNILDHIWERGRGWKRIVKGKRSFSFSLLCVSV